MVSRLKNPNELHLGDLEKMPVKKLPIDSLVVTESPRRSGSDANHVRALAELEGRLPPILVHNPSMRVLDGIHRLEAARLRGAQEIEARMFGGDDATSFVLAVQANIAHGLPLSLPDRKAAAARIIDSYPVWSDRMIASMSGLSHKTVAAVRARLTGQGTRLDVRVGRDGRVRPRNTGERREVIVKLINDNPGASLREIARKSNVSPETVRRVRASLAHDSGTVMSADPDLDPDTGLIPSETSTVRRVQPIRRVPADEKSSLDALRADPAFRSTDSGRFLLRTLSAYMIIRGQRKQLLEGIPFHCLTWVALAAREYATEWNKIADQAEAQRQGF